jgi:hypothetical protein
VRSPGCSADALSLSPPSNFRLDTVSSGTLLLCSPLSLLISWFEDFATDEGTLEVKPYSDALSRLCPEHDDVFAVVSFLCDRITRLADPVDRHLSWFFRDDHAM